MTPMVFPSSFLLRSPARTPTLNMTESRFLPLHAEEKNMSQNATEIDGMLHAQRSEASSAILEAQMVWLWVMISESA